MSAGVAHDVNTPLGISLTVASSFARRAEMFDAVLRSDGQLRRSQLEEFVRTSRDAGSTPIAGMRRARSGRIPRVETGVTGRRISIRRRTFRRGGRNSTPRSG